MWEWYFDECKANMKNLKRAFDIFLIITTSFLTLPLILMIMLLLIFFNGANVFHVSKRIGKKNLIFNMYKFRTMKLNTPQIATHLMKNPEDYTSFIGRILRKLSLDELPQLYNVLIGEMSLVGPRPALFNQKDLINLRNDKEIFNLLPGITGWSQINGRDDLSIEKKVELDDYYKKNMTMLLDIKIILKTFVKVFNLRGITH